jgi:hypothetical protein
MKGSRLVGIDGAEHEAESPFVGVLLSPMIAAVAMSLSSLSAVANAVRLRTR